VKVGIHNPVLLPKTGIFILRAMKMEMGQKQGASDLKLFLTISLTFHVALLLVVGFLFPALKIERFIPLRLELTLLPSPLPAVAEANPLAKALPVKIKKPETNKAGQPISQPVQNEPSIKNEAEKELPPPVEPMTKEISVEETKPLPQHSVEEAIVKEPVVQERVIALTFEENPPHKREENPFPLRVASSKGEQLSISVPPSYSRKIPIPPDSETGSKQGRQTTSKLGPSTDQEIVWARPKYAENPKPSYPQEARKKGMEGEVLLRVEVLISGQVGQIEVKRSSGHETLDQSALSTVKKWKFIPAQKGEAAILLWVNIPIKFQLQ
jgi:periplasmic protein TonB